MACVAVAAARLQSGAAAAAGGEQEAADIARLARALVAAYERGGRAFALNRIVGGTNNWRLRAKMADDSFFSNAVDWSFGGPGVQLLGWCLRAEGFDLCASSDNQCH